MQYVLSILAAMTIFFSIPVKSYAVEIIPDFGEFADDDGTELWLPNNEVYAYQPFAHTAFWDATSFGFYFANDPTNLITIFDTNDVDMTADGSDPQQAVINFSTGEVFDVDDIILQSSFTNPGTSIGFWAGLHLNGPNFDPVVFFTQSALTGGLNVAMTRPSITDPSVYGLIFFHPEAAETTTTIEIVAGITPVPEPATLILLGLGLTGLIFLQRRRVV